MLSYVSPVGDHSTKLKLNLRNHKRNHVVAMKRVVSTTQVSRVSVVGRWQERVDQCSSSQP